MSDPALESAGVAGDQAAQPSQPRRRRPPRPKPSRLKSLPVTIRYGLPLAAIVLLATLGYQAWRGSFTYLSVVDAAGEPVGARGTLEFFVFDDSSAAASPTAKLGEQDFDGLEPVAVGSDLVSGPTLVRVQAEGFGLGASYVERAEGVQVCSLGPATAVRGTVKAPDGKPAAGARVQAFGGGRHGVLLAEASADAEGTFEVADLSAGLAYVLLRVFHPDSAVLEQDAWLGSDEKTELQLEATRPVTGRVVVPEGLSEELSAGGLRVLAFGVPGVEAEVDAEGAFELDHLPPPPTRVRLLVRPLPDGYTHRLTAVAAGDRDVELRVVRSAVIEGQVVEGSTYTGVTGAAVQHDHGPRGGVTVRCDEVGNYRIGGVPPGEVTLRAIVQERIPDPTLRRSVITGRSALRTVEIEEGETRKGIGIVLR